MLQEKKNWYKHSYRRHLIDMHIEDWDDEFLSKFDEVEYFNNLKRAHIRTPMIYLQAHTGLCYWDSQSGRVHRAFKDDNKIKRLIDLCHADGMDVIAYYSLIYNNWAYDAHPNWRMVDYAGRNSRDPEQKSFDANPRYGIVCPNNGEYRDFIKKQIKEICDTYDFEGIFLDMTFWPTVCYCDSCRERYRKETGKELPYKIDWNDPEWVGFQSRREQWIGEFAAFCTQEVKKYKPYCAVEHQFSVYAKDWKFGSTEAISEASDYCGGDLYGGFAQQSFICKAYYEITKNQPFEYMTSRCDPDLSDHTTTKALDMLKVHNFITFAHHGAFLIIDAINLDGTMDQNVYCTIGEMFKCSEPYEKYMDRGSLKADTVIYHSLQSKMDSLECEENYGGVSHANRTLDSSLGAAASLGQHHVPYTVLSRGNVHKIKDKQIVILSNTSFLSEKELDELTEYVRLGGGLYMSGTIDRRLVERLLGMHLERYTAETVVYVSPTQQGQGYFGEMYGPKRPVCSKHRHAVYSGGNKENVVLATLTLPKTLPSAVDRFASIHSNPPGIFTDIPSVVTGSYGKGRVIWSGAALEENSQRAHKDIFYSLVESLRTKPDALNTNAPDFVEITVFEDDNCDYIHCVNFDSHVPMMNCGDIEISYYTEKKAASVELLPAETVIAFVQNGDYVSFTATDVMPFQMYRINY